MRHGQRHAFVKRSRLPWRERLACGPADVTHGARYRPREVTVATVVRMNGVRVGLALRRPRILVFMVRTRLHRHGIPIMCVGQCSFNRR